MLYLSPKACIKSNGFISDTFILERGIRQGCQISALIFMIILCVEIKAVLQSWAKRELSLFGNKNLPLPKLLISCKTEMVAKLSNFNSSTTHDMLYLI